MNLIIHLQERKDLERYANLGVTSVIVSLRDHGVRGGTPFPLDELPSIVEEAKQYGLMVYVLMNRLYVEEEIAALQAALQQVKQAQVDGIYFGDLGLAYEASVLGMTSLLIYNPDTLITNSKDVEFYFDEGFKMVTLAKEITKAEVLQIASKIKQPLEVIIHGRLNMMHSKRMLLSNYEVFLNQPQKFTNHDTLYLMEEHREELMPIIEDTFGTHVFTGFSYAGFKEIKEFMEAGIQNFRIENLFLSKEEEQATILMYQKVIRGDISGEEAFAQFVEQYPKQAYSDGFMFKETGTTK